MLFNHKEGRREQILKEGKEKERLPEEEINEWIWVYM